MPEPCKNHSDCLYVMVPILYCCDCEIIENLPSVNDGEDEDEEVERVIKCKQCHFRFSPITAKN